jgi:hypothetical protein
MSLRRLSGLCAAVGLAALVSACGGLIDPSKNTVETFSGTLQPGAFTNHFYAVGKNGEITVTMTSVVPPPPNGAIAFGIGQSQGTNCFILGSAYIAQGIVNRPVQFGFLEKGSYCVQVFDPGVLTAAVTYSGSFSHP